MVVVGSESTHFVSWVEDIDCHAVCKLASQELAHCGYQISMIDLMSIVVIIVLAIVRWECPDHPMSHCAASLLTAAAAEQTR